MKEMPATNELFDKNLLERCVEEVLINKDFKDQKSYEIGFAMAVIVAYTEIDGRELINTPGYDDNIWPKIENHIKTMLENKGKVYRGRGQNLKAQPSSGNLDAENRGDLNSRKSNKPNGNHKSAGLWMEKTADKNND